MPLLSRALDECRQRNDRQEEADRVHAEKVEEMRRIREFTCLAVPTLLESINLPRAHAAQLRKQTVHPRLLPRGHRLLDGGPRGAIPRHLCLRGGPLGQALLHAQPRHPRPLRLLRQDALDHLQAAALVGLRHQRLVEPHLVNLRFTGLTQNLGQL